jgi:hypothetical protein
MFVLLVGSAHGAMLSKHLAARSLSAAGLPDPHCKTGVISMKVSGKPQSCCAGYCGTCNDYETCKSVRGQASESACCASKIYEMRCGNAPANVCLKTCSESVPPCIMGSLAALQSICPTGSIARSLSIGRLASIAPDWLGRLAGPIGRLDWPWPQLN